MKETKDETDRVNNLYLRIDEDNKENLLAKDFKIQRLKE
jgi:hypothetical protein